MRGLQRSAIISMNHNAPQFSITAEARRLCLALALGIAGALFTSRMGYGAPVAFLLSLILGTLGFIALGGKYRVFHTGVFGSALVLPLLFFPWSGKAPGYTDDEIIMHLIIAVVVPMALAFMASVIIARSSSRA